MSIAVLDRAFSILEVLARSRRALTLAELAEEGRLPKPTVHRILKSLRDLGYVEQEDRGGSYELTGRLASLREYGRDESLRQKAHPLMERLHAAFDETVNLGLLEGIFVRYVGVIETTQPLRWIVKPGARDSFRTTALGRAIVAHLPDEQQARLVTKACATLPSRVSALVSARMPMSPCALASNSSGVSVRMLTTPASASEPYSVDAGPRRISMRDRNAVSIAPREALEKLPIAKPSLTGTPSISMPTRLPAKPRIENPWMPKRDASSGALTPGS